MGIALVKNNAFSTLLSSIASGATSLTVASGEGARFPTISSGNFFYATLINRMFLQFSVVKMGLQPVPTLPVIELSYVPLPHCLTISYL
jgi:hypothetical protein